MTFGIRRTYGTSVRGSPVLQPYTRRTGDFNCFCRSGKLYDITTCLRSDACCFPNLACFRNGFIVFLHRTTPYRNDRERGRRRQRPPSNHPERKSERDRYRWLESALSRETDRYGELGGGVVLSLHLSPGWLGGGLVGLAVVRLCLKCTWFGCGDSLFLPYIYIKKENERHEEQQQTRKTPPNHLLS